MEMADLFYRKISVYSGRNRRTKNKEVFINILFQKQNTITQKRTLLLTLYMTHKNECLPQRNQEYSNSLK